MERSQDADLANTGDIFLRYGQETSDGNFFIIGDWSNHPDYFISVLKVNADGEIPGCQFLLNAYTSPKVSNMVPADAAVTVTPVPGSSGNTFVTPQDSSLVKTNLCNHTPNIVSDVLILLLLTD